MLHSNNGILLSNMEEWTAEIHSNSDESHNHAEQKETQASMWCMI